ncbi:tRNA (guanine(10)-N(2))-dimethyltransferase [Candidatus Micrarchaeota archaeon]|nr:MAG: tRNA (guanine(10)-N(2))-dimethyltransferase [Candidatus Micrarchaeota archaeon]
MEIQLEEIKEGESRLLVPSLEVYKEPSKAPVFYNPKMAFDRSLSVKVLNEVLDSGAKVLDLLSATGARAIRYAKEGKQFSVWANDVKSTAIAIVKKNAELNAVSIRTSIDEANHFLLEKRAENFDCIDIDPFGSPINFVFNASKAVRAKNGLICATATDPGALSGSFPRACFRKYSYISHKTSMKHEIGLRGLIGSIFREFAKNSLSIEPILSYANIHYYRVFLRVMPGNKRVNRGLKKMGFISWCPKCDRRHVSGLWEERAKNCDCGADLIHIGPLWIGELGDSTVIDTIKDKSMLFSTLKEEIRLPFLHYNLHYLAKVNKVSCPKIADIMAALRKEGYRVSRTHFNSNGIKTNASYDVILKALQKLSKN